MGRLIALLCLAPLASGCLTFTWERQTRDVAHSKSATDELRPAEASLAQCLDRLGAPLYAWEYKGNGMALAWGWLEDESKGITLSVPVAEHASASFSYDRIDARMRGIVLLFDADLKLELARRGYLRDLAILYHRRRPADTSQLP